MQIDASMSLLTFCVRLTVQPGRRIEAEGHDESLGPNSTYLLAVDDFAQSDTNLFTVLSKGLDLNLGGQLQQKARLLIDAIWHRYKVKRVAVQQPSARLVTLLDSLCSERCNALLRSLGLR